MGGAEQKRSRTSVWGTALGLVTAGICAAAGPSAAQQANQATGPGDQIFTFGIDQKFGVNDNIRLDPNSVGTTYYSDTTFSFGFASQTQQQIFDLDASGVFRMVDDPVVGTDAEFRDPRVDLFFERTNGNQRLTLYANYDRPDLAFLDPLQQVDINGQDITRSTGTREDIRGGITLETGLQAPLGFLIDVNTRERNYQNTTDPTLFGNRTENARLQANLQLSPVARGRFYGTAQNYEARNNVRTETDTRTLGFGVTRDLDPATVLDFDLGYSRVETTTQAIPPSGGNPGVGATSTDFEGYVTRLGLNRKVPDGQVFADFDSALNRRGRQSTLAFGRDYTLQNSTFGFTLGATTGDNFDIRPVGSLTFSTSAARSSFDASLSRTVRIDESLDQITETTRVDLAYITQINARSSLDLAVNYADVGLVGNNGTSNTRDRLGATATYVRDVAQSWQFRVGYGYRAFYPAVGQSSDSNEIFFSLRKVLDVYR